jgi:hypothetical protein
VASTSSASAEPWQARKFIAPHSLTLAIFTGRAHMCAMLKDFDPTDYSVVVKSRAPLPRPWRWEIYCAGKRQPIQRSDVFFESREKASATGKEALAKLLEKLST